MLKLHKTIYTLGHSDHSIEYFITLLTSNGIKTLIDVRSHPASKNNPQFNMEEIRDSLQSHEIIYHWAGRPLGGMRPVSADSPHTQLTDEQKGFADYMGSTDFQRAAQQLVNLTNKAKSAIMCAEANPKYCHRSLIADYLLLHGVKVIHILPDITTQEHLLSDTARRESVELIYDRKIT